MLNRLLFSCLLSLLGTSLYAGWHDRKAEGWAWYEDSQPPEEKTDPPSAAYELQEIRQTLEEKLANALLDPTPASIKSYMEEQQKWLERSSYFANVWAQVLLNYPQLDYTATTLPVSQYGLQLHKKEEQEKKEALILSLVSDCGLFFFYEGKNETSVIFGNIVRELAKKYGWNTIAISLDGLEIDGFENKKNNGIAKALGVDVAPALYLINPKTNIAVPISFGLVAMDKIEENIALQFKELTHD
jgi:conjugal transfer pilus assembly protein TraF